MKLLLEHRADVNVKAGNKRKTPLFVAARAGELDVCRLLLKHGADVASRNKDGWGPLHLASRFGHTDIVLELLGHGTDANAQTRNNHLFFFSEFFFYLTTSLHLVAHTGFEIVQSLIRHGTALDNFRIKKRRYTASPFGNPQIA